MPPFTKPKADPSEGRLYPVLLCPHHAPSRRMLARSRSLLAGGDTVLTAPVGPGWWWGSKTNNKNKIPVSTLEFV